MPLKFLRRIELPPHAQGGFDHADVHHTSSCLFVAHTANDAVDVIDCASDQYLYSIPELRGVAGVWVAQELNEVFTANRNENKIGFFQVVDRSAEKMMVGRRPNGLAWDARRQTLWVGNVGHPTELRDVSISVVDFQKTMVIGTIELLGRPRWMRYDERTDATYVNIVEPAVIVVIAGSAPLRIARTIEVPAVGPHGLDMDSASGRLFCACDEGVLVTLDAASGRVLARTPIAGAPDVVFYNAARKHLYVAIGKPGVIDVVDTETLRVSETIETEEGAHTLALDVTRHKVYAFCPQSHAALVFVDE